MEQEFDADFQRALLETVSFDRRSFGTAQDDNNQPYWREQQAGGIASERLRDFIYRFNRTVFELMCDFGRLDLVGNFNKNLSEKGRSLIFGDRLKQSLGEQSRWSRKRWPYILLSVYVLCNIFLLINTYFQYIYNANTAKLNKLQKLMENSTNLSWPQDVQELERKFQARAREGREWVKWLGSTHPEWPFVMQSVVLIFILSSSYIYFLLPTHHIFNGWYLLGPLTILDADLENRFRAQAILEELRKFSANNWAFASSKLGEMGEQLASLVGERPNLLAMASESLESACLLLERKHDALISQLREIALSGRLRPLNRSPACRDRLNLVGFWALTIMEFYMQFIIVAASVFLRVYFSGQGINTEFETIRDYIYEFFIYMLFEILAHSALLFGSFIVVTWYDQVLSVRLLRRLIVQTVRWNGNRFKLLANSGPNNQLQPTRWLQFKVKRALEQDLLAVLIQYKMFIDTTKLARTPLSLCSFAAIWFAALVLVISRLHTPYFHQDLRSINLVIGIGCVSCAFLYLYPMSQLHYEAIKTFRELWQLMAQLSHFGTVSRINKVLELDSNVVVQSLRRELADSKLRTSQLACAVFSVPITSKNLIKFAFWAFLVIVSISSNINPGGSGFAALSSDPFGLFDFIPLIDHK